jgi:glycosyltransferase involved in cell wall biosynthesis
MKVLLIADYSVLREPTGGIGTYTRILAEALSRRGVETHVLSFGDGSTRQAQQVNGFTLHTAPEIPPRGLRRFQGLDQTRVRLVRAAVVRREHRRLGIEFDVVEVPELLAGGLFLASRGRPALVIRLHSSSEQLFSATKRESFDGKVTMWLESLAIRRARMLTSTTPNLRSQVVGLKLDPARTRAIPCPIRVRAVAPPSDSPPRVAFVGRLESRKGPQTLIRAAPRVLAAKPDVQFRLIGPDTFWDGKSWKAQLKQLAAELGVAHAIEFVGGLGHDALFDELATATVCAFPSEWESFGNTVAEAASIGRPVVVSDIPAFRDYVEDGVTGRIVSVHDINGWADALRESLEMPERTRAMALRLRDVIIARANPERVADLTIQAYREALDRSRA